MSTENSTELPERYTDLGHPDSFFQRIGDAELEMRPMDHDDGISLTTQLVPGGKFGFEIAASYTYIGYECNQNICLDRESAEKLYEALGEALESPRQ